MNNSPAQAGHKEEREAKHEHKPKQTAEPAERAPPPTAARERTHGPTTAPSTRNQGKEPWNSEAGNRRSPENRPNTQPEECTGKANPATEPKHKN